MAMMQEEMEDAGRKLFLGGIAWETSEEHLLKYFEKYGEVEEVTIMRDRITGRSRGFGYIVFADLAVAKYVIMEKHMIDGRMVEAKKAIPRNDIHALNKGHGVAHGSRGSSQTKKIFVGGLASTITKVEFAEYFKQFGTITDVFIVYDHNTQHPRGFGFISYDSEDAVERALFNTFHKLKGKMVEVKRAIPKERPPRPSMCPPVNGFNYIPDRANCFLPRYGWNLNPYCSGNSDGFNNYVGYGGVSGKNGSLFDLLAHNLWDNLGLNHSSSSTSSRNWDLSGTGNNNVNWENPDHVLAQGANNCSFYGTVNDVYGSSETNFGQGSNVYGRNARSNGANTFNQSTNGYARNFGDPSAVGGSIYGNTTWGSGSFEHDVTGTFGHGLQNYSAEVTTKALINYLGALTDI